MTHELIMLQRSRNLQKFSLYRYTQRFVSLSLFRATRRFGKYTLFFYYLDFCVYNFNRSIGREWRCSMTITHERYNSFIDEQLSERAVFLKISFDFEFIVNIV